MSKQVTITKIIGMCQFPNCKRKATHIAAGRYMSPERSGYPLGCYCEDHAAEVADEGGPEYHAHCPNCDCVFGIN